VLCRLLCQGHFLALRSCLSSARSEMRPCARASRVSLFRAGNNATCSSNARNSASGDGKPHGRSTATDRHAICRQPSGNYEVSAFQLSATRTDSLGIGAPATKPSSLSSPYEGIALDASPGCPSSEARLQLLRHLPPLPLRHPRRFALARRFLRRRLSRQK
jgi:hypothetical protein